MSSIASDPPAPLAVVQELMFGECDRGRVEHLEARSPPTHPPE